MLTEWAETAHVAIATDVVITNLYMKILQILVDLEIDL